METVTMTSNERRSADEATVRNALHTLNAVRAALGGVRAALAELTPSHRDDVIVMNLAAAVNNTLDASHQLEARLRESK